jgi:hypothetical protein
VLCSPGWLDALETDRRGDLPSVADGPALRPEGGFGIGPFLDLSGTGDRNLEGVFGERGVLGVGGSRLWKWHGRVTFFLASEDGERSTGRRAGTGMRLGVFCTLERREWLLIGDRGAGLEGVPGNDTQSSERLSSHGGVPIVLV